jgi:hypothetical protein
MSIEEEKIEAIRHYLLDALPGYDVRDSSRTHVDRTLTVFHGLEIVCTVQIPTALLDEDHPSVAELIQALKQNNVGAWVLSAPVVYLHHNTFPPSEAQAYPSTCVVAHLTQDLVAKLYDSGTASAHALYRWPSGLRAKKAGRARFHHIEGMEPTGLNASEGADDRSDGGKQQK